MYRDQNHPISSFEIESKAYRDRITAALQMSKDKIQNEDLKSRSYPVNAWTDTPAGYKTSNTVGNEDFCYIFDSTVARSYAKKYSTTPGKLNEFSDLYKNHSLLGEPQHGLSPNLTGFRTPGKVIHTHMPTYSMDDSLLQSNIILNNIVNNLMR